ncbi:MAG: DUF5050 domain-containing protein, partial [Clostridia bacterium]|nr:DUF5050 domain-containing protein [Clostridia bacterium]
MCISKRIKFLISFITIMVLLLGILTSFTVFDVYASSETSIYVADDHLRKERTEVTAEFPPPPLLRDISISEMCVSDDGWIYFATASHLCKIKTDGSELTELLEKSDMSEIRVPGDGWIYFVTTNDLWKIKTDGSELTEL